MNLDDKRVEAAIEKAFEAAPSSVEWGSPDPISDMGLVVRAAITAYLQAGGGEDWLLDIFPAGAIHNGRVHDEAGDAGSFRECFDYLATWAIEARTRIEELEAVVSIQKGRHADVERELCSALDRAEAAEQERDALLDLLRMVRALPDTNLTPGVELRINAALSQSPVPKPRPVDERDSETERLREALEKIAEEHDAGRHDGLPEPCPAHDDVTMWAIARTALTPGNGVGDDN